VLCGLALYRARSVPAFLSGDETVALPIIMYHSILQSRNGKYIVSPAVLEEDLRYLDEQGFETVTVEDLISYVYCDGVLPRKPIMLTFDDGHYNNLTYALPLLEKYGMRAVLAVVGSFTDGEEGLATRNPNYSYFNWEEVTQLCASDVFEVQNHSFDLHRGGGAVQTGGESAESFAARLCEDIGLFNRAMADHADCRPRAFVYPFGAYSSGSEQILRDQGFLATLICRERINRITRDGECLYALGRYNRPAGISTENFFGKVVGEL